MLRFPFGCVLGLSLVLLAAPCAHAQTPPLRRANVAETATPGLVCKVHALAELADDPNLCKWIAETIPAVVQPGTWSMGADASTPGQRVVRYYAPAKILVVSHSAAVQAEVDAFLANVKKSLPTAKAAIRAAEPGIMPASYVATAKPMAPVAAPPLPGYPVPTATKGPKHLFHFIIRYEGDGVIDSNIVDFTKAMQSGASMVREMPARTSPQALTPETSESFERIGIDFNQPNPTRMIIPPGMSALPLPLELVPSPRPTTVVPPRGASPVRPMPPVEAKSSITAY